MERFLKYSYLLLNMFLYISVPVPAFSIVYKESVNIGTRFSYRGELMEYDKRNGICKMYGGMEKDHVYGADYRKRIGS